MTAQSVPRYSASAALAVLMTGGLLLLMQAMIATGRDPIVESVQRLLPVIVPTRDPAPPRIRTKPQPLPPPADRPMLPETTPRGGERVHVQVTRPDGPDHQTTITTGQAANGAPIALVKVAAVYPPRAITRGLEGYVIVEFTVTPAGSVADVRVVESSDPIFEPGAIAAAQKFRYRPRIVDGVAVASPGVLNKFTFSLEN